MMAGPGDEIAAAESRSRGDFRASHADREQVISTLKAAFVQGMLAKDEFDQRVGQAFASRTHAELAALTADLPVKPAAAQPPRPVQAQGEQPVLRPGPVLAVATALYAGVWAFTFLPSWPTNSEGDPPRAIIMLVFSTTLIYLFVLVIAVGHMLVSRHENVPAAGHRGGQHRARAVRHPAARHRSARVDSSRRPRSAAHRRSSSKRSCPSAIARLAVSASTAPSRTPLHDRLRRQLSLRPPGQPRA